MIGILPCFIDPDLFWPFFPLLFSITTEVLYANKMDSQLKGINVQEMFLFCTEVFDEWRDVWRDDLPTEGYLIHYRNSLGLAC